MKVFLDIGFIEELIKERGDIRKDDLTPEYLFYLKYEKAFKELSINNRGIFSMGDQSTGKSYLLGKMFPECGFSAKRDISQKGTDVVEFKKISDGYYLADMEGFNGTDEVSKARDILNISIAFQLGELVIFHIKCGNILTRHFIEMFSFRIFQSLINIDREISNEYSKIGIFLRDVEIIYEDNDSEQEALKRAYNRIRELKEDFKKKVNEELAILSANNQETFVVDIALFEAFFKVEKSINRT